MAIITEPLPADEIVFGSNKSLVRTSWKGRSIVSKTCIPHDPLTNPQLGIRSLMKFAANRWHVLSWYEISQWEYYCAFAGISAFPFYLQTLLNRWVLLKAPHRCYPTGEETDPIAVAAHSFHGGHRFATLTFTPADDTFIYGLVIFRSTSEITAPAYTQAIVLIPTTTINPISYTDSPLDAGTYHYRAAFFTDDGVMGPIMANDTVTVT